MLSGSDGTGLSLWSLVALMAAAAGPRGDSWSAVSLFWGLDLVARFLFLPAPFGACTAWTIGFFSLTAGLAVLGRIAWIRGWGPRFPAVRVPDPVTPRVA